MLLAYVAHHARGSRRAPDGVSERAHWVERARRGDAGAEAMLAQLDGPPFPDTLGYLHGWFVSLSNTRSVGMAGVNPISFEQIAAWARLSGESPEPHEVDAILSLDAAWRSAMMADSATTPAAEQVIEPTKAWPTKKPSDTLEVSHG